MSVSKDVIAETLGVSVDDVFCEKCKYLNRGYSPPMCDFWHLTVNEDEFCSFYSKKGAGYGATDDK